MDRFPIELLEKVLCDEVLSIQDVVNFSAISKNFRSVVLSSSTIWKQKLNTRWPKFGGLFDINFNKYLDEVQYIYRVKKRIYEYLVLMPSHFFGRDYILDSDMSKWTELSEETMRNYDYIIEILTEIVTCNEPIKSVETVPLTTPGNKTLHFYAITVLRFLKQNRLTKIWKDFGNLSRSQQTLEKGATFLAQWCQTDLDVSDEDIGAQLDYIAQLVRERLLDINAGHPFLSAKQTDLDRWKSQNIEGNQWSFSHCQEVIVAMRTVLYSEMGFREEVVSVNSSFINLVSEREKSWLLYLAVVYEGVGRRLGILFEPLDSRCHPLMKFRFGENNFADFYINLRDGSVVQKYDCPYSNRSIGSAPVMDFVGFVERMIQELLYMNCKNVSLKKTMAELWVLIKGLEDLNAFHHLMLMYQIKVGLWYHRVPKHSRNQILNEIFSNSLGTKNEGPKLRTGDLKYAVGMIMSTSSDHKCVIYGWSDEQYTGTIEPKYCVLYVDGSTEEISQGSLQPFSQIEKLDFSPDVGLYFSHFFENHFVPNAELEREYPDDKKIRHKYCQDMLLRRYQPD